MLVLETQQPAGGRDVGGGVFLFTLDYVMLSSLARGLEGIGWGATVISC